MLLQLLETLLLNRVDMSHPAARVKGASQDPIAKVVHSKYPKSSHTAALVQAQHASLAPQYPSLVSLRPSPPPHECELKPNQPLVACKASGWPPGSFGPVPHCPALIPEFTPFLPQHKDGGFAAFRAISPAPRMVPGTQQVFSEPLLTSETVPLVIEDNVRILFPNHSGVGQTLSSEGSLHTTQLVLHHVQQAAAILIHHTLQQCWAPKAHPKDGQAKVASHPGSKVMRASQASSTEHPMGGRLRKISGWSALRALLVSLLGKQKTLKGGQWRWMVLQPPGQTSRLW
ncbi:hypothetical protein H8959_006215 [Pygathrix nigripes]